MTNLDSLIYQKKLILKELLKRANIERESIKELERQKKEDKIKDKTKIFL